MREQKERKELVLLIMELKDWLNSINFNKEDLRENIRSYPPYIINRCLSGHLDCVMFVNEMNKYHQLRQRYAIFIFLNTLRKKKRFSPKGSAKKKSQT